MAGLSDLLPMQLRQTSVRMELNEEAPAPELSQAMRAERRTWALLLARIYDCLLVVCLCSGQTERLVAFVTEWEPSTSPKLASSWCRRR